MFLARSRLWRRDAPEVESGLLEEKTSQEHASRHGERPCVAIHWLEIDGDMGMRNMPQRTATGETFPVFKRWTMSRLQLPWFEFFAGGGMARLGLGRNWKCTFANDSCEKKARAYRSYFGPSPELKVADVCQLETRDLPGTPELIWASFPCQDLSLAGNGAGLKGSRSGTFVPFWNLTKRLIEEGRGPRIIVLENVAGAITSHNGRDFTTIVRVMAEAGFRVGALLIDAARFLPQSRPRLFIVAVKNGVLIPKDLINDESCGSWSPESLRKAYTNLPPSLQSVWMWWRLPEQTIRTSPLSSLIEKNPRNVQWHDPRETARIISMMSDLNKSKLLDVQRAGGQKIGTVYRRTRPTGVGRAKTQRAEIRFDEISGCLRTPVGGSSRQIIVVVEGRNVRSRLLSPREAARLMGVPENYPLPSNYNEAYHLFGDGLAVPVVSWLEKWLLRPLAYCREPKKAA